MSYGIRLSWNNQQEGFQLPVNPDSIEISDGSKSKTYDVAGLGEINIIKNPKLTEYSFSSFFPALDNRVSNGLMTIKDPFIVADILLKPKKTNKDDADGYVDYILRWMATKQPIRFVFTGKSFYINEAVSIEGFDWKEVAGSGGDIEYSLKLKKYVFYAARRAEIVKADSGTKIQKKAAERQNDKQKPKTYTMAAGDTLWKVAQKIFSDGSRWKELQKLNNIPDAKLKSLPIGMVLKLPE